MSTDGQKGTTATVDEKKEEERKGGKMADEWGFFSQDGTSTQSEVLYTCFFRCCVAPRGPCPHTQYQSRRIRADGNAARP